MGGAVATEAQRIYHSLSEEEQQIARCIFLSLIQLNDDKTATRRRATISELITTKDSEPKVRNIIHQFARSGVWILVTSANQQQIEIVEVAHEALIQHWKELRDWINGKWDLIQQKRKIEQAAQEWQEHNCSCDYLLSGRALQNAGEFMKQEQNNPDLSISSQAEKFIKLGLNKRSSLVLRSILVLMIFPALATFFLANFFFFKFAQFALLREDNDCIQNREAPLLVRYMILMNQRDNLENLVLCNDDLSGFDLSGTTLWMTNFKAAQLQGTNFQDAFLVEADFRGANLRDANLRGAFIEGAIFDNSLLWKTDLSTVQGATEEQLSKAQLCETQLPDNIELNANRDCQVLRD